MRTLASWIAGRRTELIAYTLAGFSTFLGIPAALADQLAHLLKDIDATPVVASSTPRDFVRGDTLTYFFAWTPQTGRELWVSDGTEAGTHLVSDTEPGPAERIINGLAVVGNQAYFTELRETGAGVNTVVETILWTSDGTAAGTHEVSHVLGVSDDSDALVAAGGRVYFAVHAAQVTNIGPATAPRRTRR